MSETNHERMPASLASEDIVAALKAQAGRGQVTDHPFLNHIAATHLSTRDVEIIVQQYWFPIHHFTEFLPRVIALAQSIPMRTYVSKILWQELGEGDPARAHETLYLQTMNDAGIDAARIRNAAALPATTRLIEGYRRSVEQQNSAVGFLYGTEVIDLAMVSAVGAAVKRASGVTSLPWVDIHVTQEPDHVSSVNSAATVFISAEDHQEVIAAAALSWSLWSDFYNDIQEVLSAAMPRAPNRAVGYASEAVR